MAKLGLIEMTLTERLEDIIDGFIPHQGELIIYLDVSMLHMFVRHDLVDSGKKIFRDCQIVYSSETLRDIKNSAGRESELLDVLNCFGAIYFGSLSFESLKLKKYSSMNIIDSYQIFNEYTINQTIDTNTYGIVEDFDYDTYVSARFNPFMGFNTSKVATYSKIHKSMHEDIMLLKREFGDLAYKLEQEACEIKEEFEFNMLMSKGSSRVCAGNPFLLLNDEQRKIFSSINQKGLHCIERRNVVDQVCCGRKLDYSDVYLEYLSCMHNKSETLFSEMLNYQKVNYIYNVLDALSCFSDRKVYKEKSSMPIVDGGRHASMAMFADVLISGDIDFIKKVAASYEFLNVRTRTFHLDA